jgi:hypothetical protein
MGPDLKEVRRFDEAITACQDAAAIYRETCDQYREGITRENLARSLQSAPETGERVARTLGRPLGQHMARWFLQSLRYGHASLINHSAQPTCSTSAS